MRQQVMRYRRRCPSTLSLHTSLAASHPFRGVSEVLNVVRTKSWPDDVTWLPLPSQWDPIAITSTKTYWVSPIPGATPWHLNVTGRFSFSLPHAPSPLLPRLYSWSLSHFNLSLKCQLTFSLYDNPKQLTRWHSKAYRSRSCHICKLWGKKKISFWYLFFRPSFPSLYAHCSPSNWLLELHDSA